MIRWGRYFARTLEIYRTRGVKDIAPIASQTIGPDAYPSAFPLLGPRRQKWAGFLFWTPEDDLMGTIVGTYLVNI